VYSSPVIIRVVKSVTTKLEGMWHTRESTEVHTGISYWNRIEGDCLEDL